MHIFASMVCIVLMKMKSLVLNQFLKRIWKDCYKLLDKTAFPCTFITQEEMYMNYANDLVVEVQRDISSDVAKIKDISNVLQEDILQVIPYGN